MELFLVLVGLLVVFLYLKLSPVSLRGSRSNVIIVVAACVLIFGLIVIIHDLIPIYYHDITWPIERAPVCTSTKEMIPVSWSGCYFSSYCC